MIKKTIIKYINKLEADIVTISEIIESAKNIKNPDSLIISHSTAESKIAGFKSTTGLAFAIHPGATQIKELVDISESVIEACVSVYEKNLRKLLIKKKAQLSIMKTFLNEIKD